MPWRVYGKVVDGIFEAALDPGLLEESLGEIADFAGASGAAYLLINRLTGRVTSLARSGPFAGNRADYLSHYSKIDPFKPLQEEMAAGHFLFLSDAVPGTTLKRDEWYNDYILSGGVRDLYGAKLAESLTHAVIFAIYGAVGETDPFPRNVDMLQALANPLCSAARLHLSLIDMGIRMPIALDGLGDIAGAVIFADSNGKIVETNAESEAILRRGDGLTMHHGQLRAQRNFETAKLGALIARATASDGKPSAGCMLVGRDGRRAPLIVRVAPVNARRSGYAEPMALIAVSVPADVCVSERELAELYGLSPAESRLALALEQGKRVTDLVADFGVQITTLRTQLSSTLKKCGVKRQSDLVRLIGNIPVHLPARTPSLAAGVPRRYARDT